MYIIVEALFFTNLCSICIICCLCSAFVHVIQKKKSNNDTKEEYTQTNLQSEIIPLVIIHPNNDMDMGNNS